MSLTQKRKTRRKSTFLPKVIEGKPLNPNTSVAVRYEKKLRTIVRRMTDEVEREIFNLFKKPVASSYFAQDDTLSAQAKILLNALQEKFSDLFGLEAKPFSDSFINDSDRASAASLHGSLKELSRGMTLKADVITGEIKEILAASVTENVGLIKSIPSKYLSEVNGAVMRSITTGNGLADLVPFLKKHKNMTERRATFIAKDQTKKAFANLNRARLEKLGVSEYKWLHSRGSLHPRKLHQEYNGLIFKWSEPPILNPKTGERAHPGIGINCKCKALPVIRFDDE